jgi:amidohydrolase
MIEWRRYLHMYPELSFDEHDTARYIADILAGIPGIEVRSPTPTSVLGVLRGGGGPGSRVALRADIDALPIVEENEFSFRSQREGVMHACGPDGHAAMLLGAATVLGALSPQLHGEIRFVFQHAEERLPGGARELVAAGVLEDVDLVTGCHLLSTLQFGRLAAPAGVCTAAADTFTITVTGKGGHGAFPHLSVDPIVIGAQVVTNLQQIVSRRTSPLASVVVSVTQFHGGAADTVIPDAVRLGGTVRSFEGEVREQTRAAIEQTIAGIVAAHGAGYELDYVYGYDAGINDAQVSDLVARCVGLVHGTELVQMEPLPAGDDMTYFLQAAPGAYFFVGTRSDEAGSTYPHHHPRFTIDERSLPHGAETLVRTALAALT